MDHASGMLLPREDPLTLGSVRQARGLVSGKQFVEGLVRVRPEAQEGAVCDSAQFVLLLAEPRIESQHQQLQWLPVSPVEFAPNDGFFEGGRHSNDEGGTFQRPDDSRHSALDRPVSW